jgi:putative Mg2+ transporter-C (MgtC) family protein
MTGRPAAVMQGPMTDPQILVRIFAAAVATSLLGLERSRRRQNIGARTFGLIGLGGAVAGVMAVRAGAVDPTALSRALQGVLMGVGFLGAGVIVHPGRRRPTVGVTTAAAIWVAAVVGFAAGLAEWLLVVAGVGFSLLLLMIPEPLEIEQAREPAPSRPRRRKAAEAQLRGHPPAP